MEINLIEFSVHIQTDVHLRAQRPMLLLLHTKEVQMGTEESGSQRASLFKNIIQIYEMDIAVTLISSCRFVALMSSCPFASNSASHEPMDSLTYPLLFSLITIAEWHDQTRSCFSDTITGIQSLLYSSLGKVVMVPHVTLTVDQIIERLEVSYVARKFTRSFWEILRYKVQYIRKSRNWSTNWQSQIEKKCNSIWV